MNRTKIEWTDYTWNPIKGLCPVGCWYCYARKIYRRFGLDDTILMQESELYEPAKLKKPSKIFVCSTIELFHPDVKINTGAIFNVIKENPQHIFQVLTKFPQNIDRPMPDNVWLGVTVTDQEDVNRRIPLLFNTKAHIKFVSIEPMLDSVDLSSLICYNPMYENKNSNGKPSNESNSKGRIRSRFMRKNMATEKAGMGQVGKKGNREAMPPSAGGKQNWPRILTGKIYDTREASECLRPSNSLSSINRENTKWNVDQPQKRSQGRQQVREFRIDNTKSKHYSFEKSAKSGKVRSGWRKKLNAQAFCRRCQGHSPTSSTISGRGKDTAGTCRIYPDEKIRGFSRNNFSDSQKNILEVDLIIIGRLTGHGHKYDPPKEWIDKIITTCQKYNTPLFLKDNLKEIWGEKLIQEFP